MSTPAVEAPLAACPDWPPVDAAHAPAPRISFAKPRQFYWKTALLAVSTIALVPILLAKSEVWARVYLVLLIAVHLVGPVIMLWGASWRQMASNPRTLALRALGVILLLGLLVLASKGVQDTTRGTLFWGSLFAIWALHTGALALLHIRGREASTSCPFA
jgi:hypothetical protein